MATKDMTKAALQYALDRAGEKLAEVTAELESATRRANHLEDVLAKHMAYRDRAEAAETMAGEFKALLEDPVNGTAAKRIVAATENGEPCFVLRARDVTAPGIVDSWAFEAARAGVVNAEKIGQAILRAAAMRAWQAAHGSRIPE